MINKNTLGAKKWHGKETLVTKRRDMRVWPRLHNNNAYEIKGDQSEAVYNQIHNIYVCRLLQLTSQISKLKKYICKLNN